ncbi:hypothetical protein, variant 2 [Aphanomyces invadans]|uniref:START domain-containing protein n=1 Tax=Aphanomyces invadans TaxID=157072 RepID=A0A024UFV9_9STRA|nr:hypothetical protein, variant 1 [Aphanomyces invadans]XP_008866723.1 hypothetical protein, variant 2 [Aphanomyces invadans]ETW05285.1 hypothetical protein, variant 1 [Aphanomyces invadans]ETW05286.1 hypothetical protein, variant 2 [Aphanomyces invadans]|eukprot:XP_008866722.1 hypothetical protein, variant 1 [Aphanomyces invadans]
MAADKSDADRPWDVLQDLPFLFASDNVLDDELAYVSDLLEPSSTLSDEAMNTIACTSDESSSPPPTKPPKINKFRERQRQEIRSLRLEVQALKASLLGAQRDALKSSTVSSWERAAREEQFAAGKALYENERLRQNVQHNATFIDDMSRVLSKRPRLTLTMDGAASDAWKECKLAAHAALRVVAMHAIADRQYNLLDSAFRASGLVSRTQDGMHVAPRIHPQDASKLIIEYSYQFTIPAPPVMLANAVWDVCSGSNSPTLPPGATRVPLPSYRLPNLAASCINPWFLFRTLKGLTRRRCTWQISTAMVTKWRIRTLCGSDIKATTTMATIETTKSGM